MQTRWRLSTHCCLSCDRFARLKVRAGRAGWVSESVHALGQGPRRSPGTNSPPDCLCPGSLPRPCHEWPGLLLYFPDSLTHPPRQNRRASPPRSPGSAGRQRRLGGFRRREKRNVDQPRMAGKRIREVKEEPAAAG
jgi:hypothetical protein